MIAFFPDTFTAACVLAVVGAAILATITHKGI